MKKISKSNKPYTLKCEEGYVAEVSKGQFIGQGEDNETTLVDDLCDGYVCPFKEADSLAEEFLENSDVKRMKEYPQLHYIEKFVKVYPSRCLYHN